MNTGDSVGFDVFALGCKDFNRASFVNDIGVGWCRDGRLL